MVAAVSGPEMTGPRCVCGHWRSEHRASGRGGMTCEYMDLYGFPCECVDFRVAPPEKPRLERRMLRRENA